MREGEGRGRKRDESKRGNALSAQLTEMSRVERAGGKRARKPARMFDPLFRIQSFLRDEIQRNTKKIGNEKKLWKLEKPNISSRWLNFSSLSEAEGSISFPIYVCQSI